MDAASQYAFTHGVAATRGTLAAWRARPRAILWAWTSRSLRIAAMLLGATWMVALVVGAPAGSVLADGPPLSVGGLPDVRTILSRNLLVLALHAMACVAGFIAGSSLPLQAARQTGVSRWVHERGRPLALGFVVCATGFSLSMQALSLGQSVALLAAATHASAGLVVVALLPHAVPELAALFLPLAAWVLASRRGEWEQLLAATVATTAIALPVLVLAAVCEVFVSPHVVVAVLGGRG